MKATDTVVACPRCGRAAGNECITATGRPALEVHASRRAAARAADGDRGGLAAELRRRRHLLGLSHRELGRRSRVCRKSIHNAEHGTIPNGRVLGALLAALGCELVLTEPGELSALRARVAELEAALSDRQQATDSAAVRDLRAQNGRYRAALDALARQPVLAHDLIDEARAAVAGSPTPERTAA